MFAGRVEYNRHGKKSLGNKRGKQKMILFHVEAYSGLTCVIHAAGPLARDKAREFSRSCLISGIE